MIIEFEIIQNGYVFKDAIHLLDDHTLTTEEINAMKQARFDDWYTVITTPGEYITSEPADAVVE